MESVPPTKQYVIHRPIQVDARSRVDTWQTLTSQRRAHSATEVINMAIRHGFVDLFL